MRRKPITAETHLEVDGIQGFFMRKVTKFGNSAKVDCPKEFIGYTVYLVITNKKSE
jgi:putative transposon-encoded protein